MSIAGAIAATLSPAAVPAVMIGATAPDWLEWLGAAVYGRAPKHRTSTHVLSSWGLAALFFAGVWDWRGQGLAFALGGVAHWLCDALTVTGVPLWWFSDRRTTLAGGRLVTGGVGEYLVTVAVVGVCAVVLALHRPSDGFMPFFRDWAGLYRAGIVDGAEWRAHRFEWF